MSAVRWVSEITEVIYRIENDTLEIDSFEINPKERGTGKARDELKAFIRFIAPRAEEFSCVKLTVFAHVTKHSHVPQHALISFYRTFGFTVYEYVLVDYMECPRMVALNFEFFDNIN